MKLNRLTLKERLEILDKLERNVPIKDLMREYKVGQSTIYDVKYKKERLKKLAAAQLSSGTAQCDIALNRKRICGVQHEQLDAAVFDWYKKQRSSGLQRVRGTELRNAAMNFAKLLEIKDFNASPGWLFKFYRRHGIGNRRVMGEVGSGDMEPFKEKLKQPVTENDIKSDEENVMVDDISDWLEVNIHEPGHGVRTNEEILAPVESTKAETLMSEPNSDDNFEEISWRKLSEIKTHFDAIINFMGKTDILRLMPYDPHFREARSIVIEEIQRRTVKRQTTVGDWLKLSSSEEKRPAASNLSTNPSLEPSTTSVTSAASLPDGTGVDPSSPPPCSTPDVPLLKVEEEGSGDE